MVASTVASRKGSRLGDHWLPLAYLIAAGLAVAILLPSALRPPAEQTNQSAELSPNAPKNHQQSIVSSFQQAQSGVASVNFGASSGGGPGGGGPGGLTNGTTPVKAPPALAATFCPFGAGYTDTDGPERLQMASPYAAPCSVPYNGNNGGATYQGVTATQILIAVHGDVNECSANGPEPAKSSVTQSKGDRTLTDIQTFLNQAYQFWGRHLQFLCVKPASTLASQEEAAAATAAETYKVFGAGLQTGEPFCTAMASYHLICFALPVTEQYYASHQPYLWSWYMTGSEQDQFGAEAICKELAGKPAQWAGDAKLKTTIRKFGVVYFQDPDYQYDGPELASDLKATCGVTAVTIAYNDTSSAGSASLSTAITELKADGVTTVSALSDPYTLVALTNAAANQDYMPEWYPSVCIGCLENGEAELLNAAEWAHAYGITSWEVQLPNQATDCNKAIQAVDPGYTTPAWDICNYEFDSFLMMANGIQGAGPTLTPTTFQQGVFKLGYRYYTDPSWAVGGGYSADHLGYSDNEAFLWYNPTAIDPGTGDQPGAYEYLYNAQRFRLGQLPATTPPYFSQGSTLPTPCC